MKNNKLYLLGLIFVTVISVSHFSVFAVAELEKNVIDKKIAMFAKTISEIEQELKEPDLTDNELKFFRDKLLKTIEFIISDEKEYKKEIGTKNELVEDYSIYLFRKDKEKVLSSAGYSVEEFKKLRKEIALGKNYLISIQKTKGKVETLLDSIENKGIRNRAKELFMLTPFYETNVWADGYKDLIQLLIDGKEKLREISNALDDKVITKLLLILGIALFIIFIYAKLCIKFLKFLLSKLECNTTKEITGYKDLLYEKSFFIFSRFLLCYMIPNKILWLALSYYTENYFLSVNTAQGLFVIIIFYVLSNIWLLQSIVSTYFIKKLNFLHPLLIESKAFKVRIYSIVYLIAGLCFIVDVDIGNVAINFNPMVYPDFAAILNLFIVLLLSFSLLRVIRYLTLYIKVANKKTLFFARAVKGFLALWVILAPVLVFIGLARLTTDIALKIISTGVLLFFYCYMYYVIREVVPLLTGTVVSFFNRITSNEEEKYLENEHELHKKHSYSKELLKHWINLLIFIGMTIFIVLQLLVAWGFPSDMLSRILNIIFLEQIHIAGKPTFSISLLVISLLSGLIVFYIFKVIRYVFNAKVLPYTSFDEGTRHAIKTTIGYMGFIFALITFIYALGVNMTALTFIISGLSIGIGFSLQELFKNFFSGFVLLVERPIKIGDILNIDGRPAKVKKIRIRCTVLESFEKDIILIPNSELVNSKVINETTIPLSNIEIGMDVDYSENPIRVAELLKTVADSHTKVSKVFKSTVEFSKFNEYSITLILKVFVKRTDKDEVTSSLNLMLFNAMKDNKIAIQGVPSSNIYVREISRSKKD